MDKQTFKDLMQKAGFKNKLELAKFLNLEYQSVNNWGSSAPFPNYLKPLLVALAKARAYDRLIDSGKV